MATVHECWTFSQIQTAAAAASSADIECRVRGKIVGTDTLTLPNADHEFSLLPGDPAAELDFSPLLSDGNWDVSKNAIEVYTQRTRIGRVRLSNFQHNGSVIKINRTGIVSCILDGLEWRDCCTTHFPYRVPSPGSAEDTVYNQLIGAHAVTGKVVITNCSAINCNQSQWDWSHCIYVDAAMLVIVNNLFEGCVNPFSFGAVGGTGQRYIVANNTIRNPSSAIDRNGSTKLAYVATLGNSDTIEFVRNTVLGAHHYFGNGYYNATNHRVDANDYSQMTWNRGSGAWFFHIGVGDTSYATWLSNGYDALSDVPVAA